MSTWDERVQKIVQAVEHDPDATYGLEYADGYVDGGHQMARWQRAALLSDEAVERAARALCVAAGENPESNELWDEEPPWLYYTDEARAALAAALGGDGA